MRTSDRQYPRSVYPLAIKAISVASMLLIALPLSVAARQVTYYYVDSQGSVLATADEQGALRSFSEFRPYGSAMSGLNDDVGYTSHVHDDEELIYMQSRYYEPALGQFLSVDPRRSVAGDVYSFSRYAYGNNNPYRFIDPDGRAPRMLGDIRLMTKDIVDSGNRLMVRIVGAFKDRVDSTEVTVTAAANVPLAGAEASKGLVNAADSVAVTTAPFKAGMEASLAVKMQMFTIDLDPATAASRVNYSAQIAYFELIGGGVEVKYNVGHKVSLSLITGLGIGGTADAVQRSVDLKDPEIAAAQAAHEREQQIRELMGIGQERENPYH